MRSRWSPEILGFKLQGLGFRDFLRSGRTDLGVQGSGILAVRFCWYAVWVQGCCVFGLLWVVSILGEGGARGGEI